MENGQMDKEKYSTSWKHLLSHRFLSPLRERQGPLIDGDGDANKQKFGAGRGWPASSVIGFVMCVSDADILYSTSFVSWLFSKPRRV